MDQFKKLEVISRTIYEINIVNVKNSEEKKLYIGIAFFQGPNIYDAFFSCLDKDFHYQNITGNIFAEYQRFREPLEKNGWRFKTKGALRNSRTSAMQVDSALGLLSYIVERGNSKPESFNIFDYEESISENDTVATQNEFWEKLVRSRSGR